MEEIKEQMPILKRTLNNMDEVFYQLEEGGQDAYDAFSDYEKMLTLISAPIANAIFLDNQDFAKDIADILYALLREDKKDGSEC